MSADAFVVEEDRKLTVEEIKQMLSDAFDAGCDLGYNEALDDAIRDVRFARAEERIIIVVKDLKLRGINVFDTMRGFEDWLKKKGGKR
jgi:hypothetical protein